MSEHLHRAVQAQLEAHTPGPTPPFEVILWRKRARDRRRGAAAVALTALAATGAVLVPGLAAGGPDSAPEQVARTGGDYFTFIVRFRDQAAYERDEPAVKGCLEDPSVVGSSTRLSIPPLVTGLLHGPGAPDRLLSCIGPEALGAGAETQTADQQPTPTDIGPYTLSPDRRTITVTAEVGGGCHDIGFATATAQETPERVLVRAVVARPPLSDAEAGRGAGTVCRSDLLTQQVQLRLHSPLGERDVIDETTGRQITGPR